MPNFIIGDRVVCISEYQPGFQGEHGVVTHIRKSNYDGVTPMLHVLFDKDSRETAWKAERFQLSSEPTLSPVCRKIRLMEKRWLVWQEKKATQEKVNAMV